MIPKYPIYIVSKGRASSRLTVKALDKIGVPFRIVIEPQEFQEYSAVIDKRNILVLPFSNLGAGSIPARNWIWEHSISEGWERHWILDDNIKNFFRFNNNLKVPLGNGASFRAAEDFSDRYENVYISGFNYFMFVLRKKRMSPFTLNTRIYSCILLLNKIPYRWRGRYNEDTDLSIRVLKGGNCTVLFNAFLAEKSVTMTILGGNTDELYRQDKDFDGRLEMAKSLQRQHPDIVKITRKWGRWQHQVDYRCFKNIKLRRKAGVLIPGGNNEYGMKLVQVK